MYGKIPFPPSRLLYQISFIPN